ncbi:MAG: ribosome silencing factor [Nitrospiria bacterium]
MTISRDSSEPSKQTNEEDAKRRALLIAEVVQSKHAEDIVIFKVSELSSLADYFVVCTAESKPQIHAISETVDHTLSRDENTKPLGIEGRDSKTWLLMDYGDIILHVFNPVSRAFYGLDRLWGDAPQITLPEIANELGAAEQGRR